MSAPSLNIFMNLSLKPHNKEASLWFINRRIGALYMEMRLGKSVVAICKANISGCKRNLIVAPYSTINDWESLLGEEHITITGSEDIKDIKAGFESKNRWTIVNKELHRKFDFKEYFWDLVCVDESTTIANPQTEITKYFMHPRWQDVPYKIVMSGTAALKSELQYFCQLYFLSKDILPFKNYWDFRLQCFKPDYTGFNFVITPKGKALLSSALGKHAFFKKREDSGIGGNKVYIQRRCEMDAKARKLYDDVTDTFTLMEQKTIFATQKFLWLRQLSSGFIEQDFRFRHKTLLLQELLGNDFRNQQVIILSSYLCEVGTVWATACHYGSCERVDGTVAKEERERRITAFIEGDLQYLSAQSDCVKWGRNLSVCNTTIFFSSPLSPETRAQAEDRTIHCDKTADSLIVDLLTEDSVDIDIRDSYLAGESQSLLSGRITKRWEPF